MHVVNSVPSLPCSLPTTQQNVCTCDPFCTCAVTFSPRQHVPVLLKQLSRLVSDLSRLEAAEANRSLSKTEQQMKRAMLELLARNAAVISRFASPRN